MDFSNQAQQIAQDIIVKTPDVTVTIQDEQNYWWLLLVVILPVILTYILRKKK